jgi:hypothetical protein
LAGQTGTPLVWSRMLPESATGGHPVADLGEHGIQVRPHTRPAIHGPPFDQGVFDHVEHTLETGVFPGELLGHAEIREGYMAHLVIQIANQTLLKVLIQGFWD